MFEDIGINTDILILVMILFIFLLIIMVLILVIRVSKLTLIYKKYMTGAKGRSLEEQFKEKFGRVEELNEDMAEYKARILKLENNKAAGFCKFAVKKYDAFEDVRGKVSFSLCMLDDGDDGFVLTGVHSADGCYTYLKEILAGNSYTKLSEEEQTVLDKAKVCNNPVAEVIAQPLDPEVREIVSMLESEESGKK